MRNLITSLHAKNPAVFASAFVLKALTQSLPLSAQQAASHPLINFSWSGVLLKDTNIYIEEVCEKSLGDISKMLDLNSQAFFTPQSSRGALSVQLKSNPTYEVSYYLLSHIFI